MKLQSKSRLRLLKVLSKNMKTGFPVTLSQDAIIVSAVKPIKFSVEVFAQLKRENAIRLQNARLLLTSSGLEQLDHELETKNGSNSTTLPAINSHESPLGRLSKLKTKKGISIFCNRRGHCR